MTVLELTTNTPEPAVINATAEVQDEGHPMGGAGNEGVVGRQTINVTLTSYYEVYKSLEEPLTTKMNKRQDR